MPEPRVPPSAPSALAPDPAPEITPGVAPGAPPAEAPEVVPGGEPAPDPGGPPEPEIEPGAPPEPSPPPSPTPFGSTPAGPDATAVHDPARPPVPQPPSDWMEALPPPEWAPRGGRRLARWTAIAALAAVGGVATFLVLRATRGREQAPDLLTTMARHAGDVRLSMRTDDPVAAAEFVYDEFGWPIEVPALAGARLVGVGVDVVAQGVQRVELPVLVYVAASGEALPVFAYDYRFLDDASDYVSLAPAVYARLAEPEALDVRRAGRDHLVVWRHRDDIFTAVTREDPTALVEALRASG